MTRDRQATRIGFLVAAVLLLGTLSAAAIAQTADGGGGSPTLAPTASRTLDDDGTSDRGHGDVGDDPSEDVTNTPSPSDDATTEPADDHSDDLGDNSGPENAHDDED